MSFESEKQIKIAFIKKATTKLFKEYLAECKIDKANLHKSMVSEEKVDRLFNLVLSDILDYANEGMQIKNSTLNNNQELDQKVDTQHEKQDHEYIEHEM